MVELLPKGTINSQPDRWCLWFFNWSYAVTSQEGKFRPPEDPHFLVLGDILKLLLAQAALDQLPAEQFDTEKLRAWINSNPPPSPTAELRERNSALAREAVFLGMILVWKGEILTAAGSLEEAQARISTWSKELKRLSWDKHQSIKVALLAANPVGNKTFVERWGSLSLQIW